MAVDVASIVVAVISLVASVAVAGFSGYLSYSSEERKAKREAERLLQKYRDPLLFAAEDLQSRLWGLLEMDVLSFAGRSPAHNDALYIYTAFVVGQFFAWTHILRRETSLTPFSLEENDRLRKFVEILHSIQGVMLLDKYADVEGTAFTMWRGHQMAIGEFMSLRDEGKEAERLCMGFYEFTKSWKTETSGAYDTLHYWFAPIEDGIKVLVEKGRTAPDGNRLRRLQHLLLDLIEVLDPAKQRLTSKGLSGCGAAPHCPCSRCPGTVGVHDGTGARKSPMAILEKVIESV